MRFKRRNFCRKFTRSINCNRKVARRRHLTCQAWSSAWWVRPDADTRIRASSMCPVLPSKLSTWILRSSTMGGIRHVATNSLNHQGRTHLHRIPSSREVPTCERSQLLLTRVMPRYLRDSRLSRHIRKSWLMGPYVKLMVACPSSLSKYICMSPVSSQWTIVVTRRDKRTS